MTIEARMIKILSGPHAGAEMCLQERHYRVGSGDDCDIIIRDKSLPATAFTINVQADGILLQEFAPSTVLTVDGQPAEDESIPVESFALYGIGFLQFCFGPTDGEWPMLSLAQYPAQSSPQQETDWAPGDAAVPSGKAADEGVEGADTGSGSTIASPGRRVKTVGGLLCFGFFCAVVVRSVVGGHTDAGVVGSEQQLELAAKVSQEWGFDALSVTRGAQGGEGDVWRISGYVDLATDETRLRQKLDALEAPYQLDLRVMESIKRSAETLLKQFRLEHLLVTIGDNPGELIISGVEPNLDYWRRMEHLLLSDIPGLVALEDQVESPESRVTLLKQWIEEEGLGHQVVVNAKDGRLTITSELSLDESPAWERVKHKFTERFGGSINLAEVSSRRPDLNIRGVSLGRTPYLVLTSGRRYIVGSHIAGGYYLDRVDSDSVVVKKGDERIKYQIGSG